MSIQDGRWGREVVGTATGVVRFIGVDGYRWMIRCVVNGSAETIDALTDEAREALVDTVVRRGDTPLPVRTPLPVQLPEPMASQLREAAAAQGAPEDRRSRRRTLTLGGRGAATAAPTARRSAAGSAMQQLRSTSRRLKVAKRRQTRGAECRGIGADLIQRHRAQRCARRGGRPFQPDLEGVYRVVCRRRQRPSAPPAAAAACAWEQHRSPLLPWRRVDAATGCAMTGSAPRPTTAGWTPASAPSLRPDRRGAAGARSAGPRWRRERRRADRSRPAARPTRPPRDRDAAAPRPRPPRPRSKRRRRRSDRRRAASSRAVR